MRFWSSRRDQRPWPTGRAEVELFMFWENDLADGSSPSQGGELIAPVVAQPNVVANPSRGSLRPLWWALIVAVLLVLLAVVG